VLALTYEEPPAENVPAGHALVVPTDWPAPHQWPAGQGLCMVEVDTVPQK